MGRVRVCLVGLLLAAGCSHQQASEGAAAPPSASAGAAMGGEGVGDGSESGDAEGGLPPSTPTTLETSYPTLEPDERAALAEFDELFEPYPATEGGTGLQFSISTDVDCESAAELRDRICELAERICQIYEEHPDPGVGDRCQRGTRGCEDARDQVSERCG